MFSPFSWIDFSEPRCPRLSLSISPRLRTTLDLRGFRGAETCTSYRRLTQISIDSLLLRTVLFSEGGAASLTLPENAVRRGTICRLFKEA